MDPVKIFVGTDRSQLLAVRVLEHSIRRHTQLPIELTPMCNLPIREPVDPSQRQRTGFSFSRFCIPKMAGYRGRAIYMDADMLVFKDIQELWSMPFNGAKVLIQEELTAAQRTSMPVTTRSSVKRKKQCAVMLLDCSRLDWDVDQIISGLDERKYNYTDLMQELCILREDEVAYDIPFRWNSLEHLDASTCLIHYTDMGTQPWVSPFNRNARPWYDEVKLMLKTGSLTLEEIVKEIELGYFRPSLLRDIQWSSRLPLPLNKFLQNWNALSDAKRGYRKHQAVYKAKAERDAATIKT